MSEVRHLWHKFRVNLLGDDLDVIDDPSSRSIYAIANDINADFYGVMNLEVAPRTILDCGANVGLWSMAMAKRYPKAFIYALEPVRANFEHLRMNVCAKPNVQVVYGGLTHDGGELTLFGQPGNSGSYSFFNRPDGYREHLYRTNTLLGLLNHLGLNFVDLVKLDIEGSEWQVLQHFTEWDRIGKLTIELHPLPLAAEKAGPDGNDARNIVLAENMYEYLLTKKKAEDLCVHALHKLWRWGVEMPSFHEAPECN